MDLPPTISRLTGVPKPVAGHGVPIFENAKGPLQPSVDLRRREHAVSTYNGQQFGLYIQRMIRTREWKYVWNHTDVDELYRLADDPEEFVNRIDDNESAEVLADLRNRLYEQLVRDDDSFVLNPWMARQLQEGRKLGGAAATSPSVG